jgi:RND family efflux transporter MFP subunit
MKNFSKVLLSSFVLFAIACGGGNNNIEKQKANLAALKKQGLELNVKIANLEKEIEKAGGAETVKAILVSVSPIAAQDFTHYIELQGKVESESVSFVTPRAGGGQVRGLFVKRGDQVKKGQLILQLDNAMLKQSAAAATLNIETLKAQATLAKSVYEKQKNLWEQNIGSEIQLLTAKTNAESLANQLKAAGEQLGMVKDQLAFTSIYSDVEGVAEEVNVKVGELFMGPGQIKIVNTTQLKLTTQIPENYAGKIKVGTEVSLNFPDIEKIISTKLSVVGNVIDPLNRSFYVETKLPKDKDFRPNQMVQVKIKDYEKKNAISAPINLLQNDEKGKFIYVAITENGKLVARKKVVIVGQYYGNNIEIISGLNAGDIIITEGYQSLFDGQNITTSDK